MQQASAADQKGLRFELTPIYGVTIPVIVRLGNLQATAGIANVHLEKSKEGGPAVGVDLSRNGTRSTFGEALEMDVAYARGWSVSLDVWLLARTPLQLLRQRKGTA